METEKIGMVELIDPQTNKTVYVNTESGECFAELPLDAYMYNIPYVENPRMLRRKNGGNYLIQNTI